MNESLEQAREAALTRPDDAEAHARLGRAFLDTGRLAEAIEALQRAVRLDPENAAIRTQLGRAWLAAADPEKAVFHLRRALELEPDDPEARALLARAENAEPELSPDFVRALFDPYAAQFDSEMAGLGYRAPEALRAIYLRVAGEPRQDRDVLDLGCGTGLAGLAFRAYARTLAGVDLSPRMAERARRRMLPNQPAARGIYDRVVVGDMTRACVRGTPENAAMMDAPAAFDLILAADALGYVGDLAPLFAAARGALRPRGHFAATVEENQDHDKDFALGPTRRFRHGETYVRRVAQTAGLTILVLERCELRRDRGEPVAGLGLILGVS